jgi:hypothetical protein
MSKFAKLNNHYIRSASLVTGQALMILAVLFLFVEGCSQAPEQYKRGKPPTAAPRVEGLESDVITDMIGSQMLQGFGNVDIDQASISISEQKEGNGSGEEGDRDRDDVKIGEENSKKPVLYGVGAAGITFKTEFSDARKILSKPLGSQSGPAADLYAYREGIQVVWKKLPPKTPENFLITNNYLGSVVIGGKFGNKKMNDSFGEYLKDDSEDSWKQLMVEMYNVLEKKSDDFNCLVENLCVTSGNDQFVGFNYPKGFFQFVKDRKTLYLAVLTKHTNIGKLDNDFDLIKGQIIAGDERIGLGDTWRSFKEKVPAEGDSGVTSLFAQKKYNGIVAGFEKRSFDRAVTEPADDAPLRSINVGVPFEKYIKVSGKYVEVLRSGNDYSFGLVDAMDPKKSYLSMGLSIGKTEAEAGKPLQLVNTLRINFMKSLVAFIDREIQAYYPKAQTITYLSGQHSIKSRKDLIGKIRIVFPDNGGGQTIAMFMNSVSGDIVVYAVQKFDGALDKRLASDFLTVLDPVETKAQIGGFKLGANLSLTDIDLGRNEATAEMDVDGVGKTKVRLKFARSAAVYTPFQAKKLIAKKAYIVEYDKFGFALVLEPTAKTAESFNDSTKTGEFTISGVQVSHVQGVKNLCELANVKFSIGEKATDLKARLDSAIREAKAKDSTYDCRYMPQETSDGLHQIGAIFFPDDNLVINFKNQEFDGIRIY